MDQALAAWQEQPTTLLTIQCDGQSFSVRATGQLALQLRALPRGATICVTLHDAPPHKPEVCDVTILSLRAV